MSLDDLRTDVEGRYADLDDDVTVALDGETRNELALLSTAFEPESTDELVRRAVHALFRTAVDTGNLDFHLRTSYDCTYDEYLSGMTYDEMTGTAGGEVGPGDDDRRYQF